MTREDFKKIIKLRSCWKIDKRKGNYTLPSGDKLSVFVRQLVEGQLKLDNFGIAADGTLQPIFEDTETNTEKGLQSWEDEFAFVLMRPFSDNEETTQGQQDKRIAQLVYEMLH